MTQDLHGNGVCGIMTDYEEKFHDLGTPINRCVGTKLHLEQEPKFRPIAGPRFGAAGRRQGAGGGPIKKKQYRGGLFRRGTVF